MVFLHHKVKFRDEVGVGSVLVEHIMLQTSRAIDVPKRLAREVLYFSIIFGLFQTDVHFYGLLVLFKLLSGLFKNFLFLKHLFQQLFIRNSIIFSMIYR